MERETGKVKGAKIKVKKILYDGCNVFHNEQKVEECDTCLRRNGYVQAGNPSPTRVCRRVHKNKNVKKGATACIIEIQTA